VLNDIILDYRKGIVIKALESRWGNQKDIGLPNLFCKRREND